MTANNKKYPIILNKYGGTVLTHTVRYVGRWWKVALAIDRSLALRGVNSLILGLSVLSSLLPLLSPE